MPADGYRVPELDSFHLHATTIENDDLMILYLRAVDKTVWVDMATVKAWVETGGTGVITPVITGNKYIHYVTASEAGGTTVSLPQYAGKNFFLWQEGGRAIDPTQYQILSGGGFKINIPDFQLQQGAQYVLEFYELAVSGGSTNALAKLFTGELPISTNYTLSPTNDVGKLVQLRGLANQLELTLFKIDELDENSVVIIEATVNNTKEHAIRTQNGQNIYMNGRAWQVLYIRPGEVVWLFRGESGYYVINDFGKVYKDLCKPFPSWEPFVEGEIVFAGQLLLRSEYPRTWQRVQAMGNAVVSDTDWLLPEIVINNVTYKNPYRGKWSRGDGTTTFRVPDFQGMYIRGLKAGSSDPDRPSNEPGTFQASAVMEHYHDTELDPNANSTTGSGKVSTGSDANEGNIPPFRSGGAINAQGVSVAKPENITDNMGLYWKCNV